MAVLLGLKAETSKAMERLVDKLHEKRILEACEYRSLLLCEDPQTVGRLHERARETAVERFGRDITSAATTVSTAESGRATGPSPDTHSRKRR